MINMGPRPVPMYADHRKENPYYFCRRHFIFLSRQDNSTLCTKNAVRCGCCWVDNKCLTAELHLLQMMIQSDQGSIFAMVLYSCNGPIMHELSMFAFVFSHTLKFSSWGHIVFLRLTSTDRLQNISKNQFWNLSVLHRGVDSGLALSFRLR